MRTHGLYLGCTVPLRVVSYELSARNLLKALGVQFEVLEDGGCCGLYFEQIDELAHLTLAARILGIAEERGWEKLIVLCNGCNSSLNKARLALEDLKLRFEVNRRLRRVGRRYERGVEVFHLVRFLHQEVGVERLRDSFKHKLAARVAIHWGCHLLKPEEAIRHEPWLEARSLRELVETTGARAVSFLEEKSCCCGYLLAYKKEITYAVAALKLASAAKAKADLLVTTCPLCNMIYDANQRGIVASSSLPSDFKLPVLHISQLIGLALGLSYEDLALDQNRVRVSEEVVRSWLS